MTSRNLAQSQQEANEPGESRNPSSQASNQPPVGAGPVGAAGGFSRPLAAVLEAIEQEKPSHVFALFSGGHDSLCSTRIASELPGFAGVIHCNTGIGIERTREYVRDTCRDQGWKLIELHPDITYEELVLKGRKSKQTGRWIQGFPCGPKSHNTMVWNLKEKPLKKYIQSLKTHRHERFGLVTGIRKAESDRRMGADMSVPVKRDGAYLYLNPILEWEAHTKNRYMKEHDLPRNFVSDVLEKSAECMCGALARRRELKEVAEWFPDEELVPRIERLERKAKEMGIDDHFWATQSTVNAYQGELFEPSPLCVGCARHYEETA